MTPKQRMGLYRKFRVSRTDGSSRKGKKHHGCRYFVLDLDHDKFARAAIEAYASACKDEYPFLAADLWACVAHGRIAGLPEKETQT